MRRRFFDKIGGDLPTDNFMVFDKSVSDPANITISEDTDPDGSTRNVNAETFSGWIINIAAENGPFFDVVPTQVGGSDSTHYSDYYSRTSDSSLVLARSGYRSYPTGGVAYTDAAYDASDMDSSYGSRLAFHGTISELAPRQFKRLPVL